ncbi:MAG: hypothetical protein ACFCD0_28965 [Gemmataceae bacterium]
MTAGLRALLHQIVDYAGQFPPATLPLDQAIRNYARYHTGAESWMLGKFIHIASKLPDLEPYTEELFTAKRPLGVSALGRGGSTSPEFLRGLDADLTAIQSFHANQGSLAKVEVLETRLPVSVTQTNQGVSLAALFRSINERVRHHGLNDLGLFCEVQLTEDFHQQIPEVVTAFREHNEAGRLKFGEEFAFLGFKLRCGGADPSAYPSVDQVAVCLRQCLTNRVAFKATAGLHHPIRHFNDSAQTHMHGFLNVFVSGVLGYVCGLRENDLKPILADEDGDHFCFEDAGVRWGEFHAPIADITVARRYSLVSFGSCSFDEPVEDLRELGWL